MARPITLTALSVPTYGKPTAHSRPTHGTLLAHLTNAHLVPDNQSYTTAGQNLESAQELNNSAACKIVVYIQGVQKFMTQL